MPRHQSPEPCVLAAAPDDGRVPTLTSGPNVEVELCPGGPMLVRGPVTVVDDDGTTSRSDRPVTALCRCGASRRKPWCDATHKLLPDGPKRD